MRSYIVDRQGLEWFSELQKVGEPPHPSIEATHRVKTDYENGRDDRPYLPMVFVFDDRRCTLTREWQYYFVAMNYGKKDNNISHDWTDDIAFCNHTGFYGKSHRRNYIMQDDMQNALPQTDKTRTCGDAKLHLTPTGIIINTRDISLSQMGDMSKDDFVSKVGSETIPQGKVLCLNGSNPPELKPGMSHPVSTQDAHTAFERYVYNPRDTPLYFFPCTTTGADNHAHAWPNSAKYPWYKNGSEPVTFMFHLAPGGDITYPPEQWTGNTPYLETL